MGRDVRVLIADDHDSIRTALCDLIDLVPGVRVVGEAHDGGEAVALVDITRPDVVIMDVRMPVMDGIEATRIVKQRHPEVRVIAHSAYVNPDLTAAMTTAGAEAFLTKGTLDLATIASWL